MIAKKYEIQIKNIENSPICWNVMKRELEEEKKKLKKNELNEWEEENWQRKAEYNDKGKVIIPERWFKQSIVEACKKTRMVPHFATSKNETYTRYAQTFMIENIDGSICKTKDLKYFGAYEGGRGKNSSTKVWRVRPMLKKWGAKFLLYDPAGRIKKKDLQTLIEYAGMFCGIGDNRRNNFGRFEIVKIEEVQK